MRAIDTTLRPLFDRKARPGAEGKNASAEMASNENNKASVFISQSTVKSGNF